MSEVQGDIDVNNFGLEGGAETMTVSEVVGDGRWGHQHLESGEGRGNPERDKEGRVKEMRGESRNWEGREFLGKKVYESARAAITKYRWKSKIKVGFS